MKCKKRWLGWGQNSLAVAWVGRWRSSLMVIFLACGMFGCLLSTKSTAPIITQSSAGATITNKTAAATMGTPSQSWHRDEILTFSLRMDPVDADVLFKKDPFDTSSFPVRLEEGQQLLPGRVEVKGSFTRRFPKKSLLIKLDRGNSWQGMRRISLNAMSTDPTMMREYLAWDIFHALGMAVPRVQYARLLINGDFVGLFLFIEWIEPQMFDRYGLGDDGAFFHPRDSGFCGDLTISSLDKDKECWFKLSPRDNDFSPLSALVNEMAATPAASFADFVDSNFDVDSVLNWIAGNVLTSDNDTYNKNYFLYRSTVSGKWTVVPWDYDLTFGRSWDPSKEFPANVYNDNFQYYYPPDVGQINPLKDKFFANPELYSRFKRRLGHLMGVGAADPNVPAAAYGWFSPARVEKRLANLTQRIGADLSRDPFEQGSGEEYDRQVATLRYYHLARYHYLQSLIFNKTVFKTSCWTPAMSALGRAEIAALPAPIAGQRLRVPREMRAAAELRKGKSEINLVDAENGLLLATLRLRKLTGGTRLSLSVLAEQPPPVIPPTTQVGQCLERTWVVASQEPGGGLVTDLRLEYLEEHSLHNEFGAAVDDEEQLRLWMLDGEGGWQQMPTKVNGLANTLSTESLALEPLRLYRFVACVPAVSSSALGRGK